MITDLARRNEELSAAVGMWQARAHHFQEQLQQLTATVERDSEATGALESSVAGDEDDAAEPDAQRGAEGLLARLWRVLRGAP